MSAERKKQKELQISKTLNTTGFGALKKQFKDMTMSGKHIFKVNVFFVI